MTSPSLTTSVLVVAAAVTLAGSTPAGAPGGAASAQEADAIFTGGDIVTVNDVPLIIYTNVDAAIDMFLEAYDAA